MPGHVHRLRSFLLAACLLTLVLLALGCGGGTSGAEPAGPLTIELFGEPLISYASPRTTVITQFIARDADGVPLGPTEVAVDMEVDGLPVDNESVLQDSSQELSSSVRYALVLDASGSMLQHTPPAFGPMREAARASVDTGVDLWAGRPGTFSWDLVWFNDALFQRQDGWAPEDILSIPEPSVNAATKLYAAVEYAAQELHTAYLGGTAAGPRDHHIMVVFSDGADNLSWFDDSAAVPSTQTTSTGARYRAFGWPSTSLEDALAAIEAHPNLTVHVLAMGSRFSDEDLKNLQALAAAGGGQFLSNPSSGSTAALFERVTKEFSTLQTRGASIPQAPGEYTFTLNVRDLERGGEGSVEFRYRAGPGAQLLQ